ncbi:unnamed protein product [Vitrella brassicaformis CCMP3155]|uniref:Protein disulfide-isomerase n=1 Tax=Vitrella brassicaformis (strain CCMP3155) TaxID=1169540 RepID=A0A0G4H885_VITBC|nr:unnamed protein product [Vitrella brassicaformis CCMP3155]|eukprot:CEM39955.1 unnamed protein product [Vitrella brassicaformis CCMP3155]
MLHRRRRPALWHGHGHAAVALLLLAACLRLGCRADVPVISEEEGVLLLTDGNFDAAMERHKMILVQFFAPWCGYCRQLAPEYAKAAKTLKSSNMDIPLAKVDATVETALAERFGVRGFPTIFFFVNGKEQEYTGGRTENAIVSWIQRKSGPPSVRLNQTAEAQDYLKRNPLALVGFFNDGEDISSFENVARSLEEVQFAHTFSPAVASHYQAKVPGLLFIKPFDEGKVQFEGDFHDPQAVLEFIGENKMPLVNKFTGDVAPELFGSGKPILVVIREENDQGRKAEQALHDASKQLKGRVLMAVVGVSDPIELRFLDYIGVSFEETPTLVLLKDPASNMVKYKMDEAITREAVLKFIDDFESADLSPFLRSEVIPAEQPGPVYAVVGKTFDDVVMKSKKDVLVFFYAPWCGHCKKFSGMYKSVAEKMSSVESILIADMDATANDVLGLDIQGFPTVKFFPQRDKQHAIDYEGERDVDTIIDFLQQHATIQFSKDEL